MHRLKTLKCNTYHFLQLAVTHPVSIHLTTSVDLVAKDPPLE